MDDSAESLRAAEPLGAAADVTDSDGGTPGRRRTPPPGPARATPSPHSTPSDEFDLDELFVKEGHPIFAGRFAQWLRASGPMTVRRSKEDCDVTPPMSPSKSPAPVRGVLARALSALDETPGRAKTRRPLPSTIVGDGFALPEFDYTTLGDVDDAVASGQQAKVYAARVSGKQAALKVMRRELAEVIAERRAFVRECHLLARIKHAHILPLYGVSTTPSGLPCVLLKWCESCVCKSLRLDEVGHDPEVRSIIKREWPSFERLRLMAELADALDHLHTRAIRGAHVAHRDVKPPNFGLTAAKTLVLCDFGLAVALLDRHSCRGDVSQLTSGTGTRRYMCPEVAAGRPYGVSVDVDGWAICAHEIFSLRGKPFWGLSMSMHAERVVKEGARPHVPSTWDLGDRGRALRRRALPRRLPGYSRASCTFRTDGTHRGPALVQAPAGVPMRRILEMMLVALRSRTTVTTLAEHDHLYLNIHPQHHHYY